MAANGVIPVQVKAVVPVQGQGCAVFLGNDDKVFTIYVDHGMGAAISLFLQNMPRERPLTHDLIGHIFKALDVKLERVVVNALKNNTFFARLILKVENEVHQKLLEIDARPSDSIALALQARAPIYVARQVWTEVEDMAEMLEQLSKQAKAAEAEEDEGGGEDDPPGAGGKTT